MISELVISLLAIAAFAFGLWWGRIVPVANEALKTTMTGLGAMMDNELDDHAKELAVRQAGIGLIVAAFSIFSRLALALAAAAAPIFIADSIGLVSNEAVISLMLRWDFIIVVSVAAILLSYIFRRARASTSETVSGVSSYSAPDRFFHMLAFSSPVVLKGVSAIEDRVAPAAARQPSASPIFVTSLARGGTTALLNALHDIPGVATHTYRDMPFLTAPVLWNRLSGGRKRDVQRQQRAHGDGLEIDLDSPEAFEEVIWKMFWPEKFRGTEIALWTSADRKPEAERFLSRHMKKIVHARSGLVNETPTEQGRYCSKNNGNIARIPYLSEAFNGCRIVVPVRRPESHAGSLLRQHHNFLGLQAEDEFVQRYMRDIGHFEFGTIHKPIKFPDFDATAYDPSTGDYWLNYWICAFREVLKSRDKCIFVLQDELRSSPQETMLRLCSSLELAPESVQFSDYFHAGPDRSSTDIYDQRLYAQARDLYEEFREFTGHLLVLFY